MWLGNNLRVSIWKRSLFVMFIQNDKFMAGHTWHAFPDWSQQLEQKCRDQNVLNKKICYYFFFPVCKYRWKRRQWISEFDEIFDVA